jgi:hypothetical protein
MDDDPKLSRRSILKEAALVAGATLAATLFPSKQVFAQKASKDAMKYQDHPSGDKQCSNCAQFVPSNSCQIVEGMISPQGYCMSWQKKS